MNRFLAQAKEAGIAVKQLGNEAMIADKKMEGAGRRGFWMGQAMFTLRRAVYHTSIGLGVLAGAAVVMGFQFDQSMEAATRAFTRFLGSPEAAKNELDLLYTLAAKTPFEFPQLTDATRKFLAFGFSVQESNSLLTDLGDAIAAFGGGTEEINRAVIALGQMRSSGRVLGQDLRQLMQLGLVDPEDFRRRLNLPQDWQRSVGNLNISSKRGIDALTAYWREKFGGASLDFSKTMIGRLTTARDYLRKAFGLMFLPLYDWLRDKLLPRVIDIANAMASGFQAGGFKGMFEAIDRLNKGSSNLAGLWTRLTLIGHPLWLVIKDIGRILLIAWEVVKPLSAVFAVLVPLLWGLHAVLSALKWPLGFLLGLFIIERSVLITVNLVKKSYIFWSMGMWLWTRNVTIAMMFYEAWVLRAEYATLLLGKATRIAMFFLGAFRIATWLAATAFGALDLAILAFPGTWIALAIIGIGVGLFVLYKKVKWFRDAVNDLWDVMRRMFAWASRHKWTNLIPGIGPLITAIQLFNKIPGHNYSGIDLIHDVKKSAGNVQNSMFPQMPNPNQPWFADPAAAGKTGKKGVMVPLPVQLNLDGKQVAEAVAEWELTMQGRG